MGTWNITSKDTPFKSKYRQIDRWKGTTPSGAEGEFHFVVARDFVVVFALTKEGLVIVNNQYHIYFEKRMPELVAGTIDEGMEPLEIAKNELQEEAGYVSDKWTLLGKRYTGRWNSNYAWYFLAENAVENDSQDLDHYEDIEITLESIDDFKQKMQDGLIENVHSDICSMLALQHLGK